MKPDARFLPVILFAVLAALCAVPLMKGIDPSRHDSALIGKPKPPQPADIDTKGAPVLVNFFASWCVPCAAEQKDLLSLSKSGLAVYGIAYKDDPKAVRDFLRRYGDPYRRVTPDDGTVALDWGVTGVPETFLIDGQGTVRARWQSAVPKEDVLKALSNLKEEAP